jgi:hypothetical protein
VNEKDKGKRTVEDEGKGIENQPIDEQYRS